MLGRGELVQASDTNHSSTHPSARSHTSSWTDNDGNLWIYGGTREESAAYQNYFSDMWKLTVTDVEIPYWTIIIDSPANYTRPGTIGM